MAKQMNFSHCLVFLLICAVGCTTAASSRDSNLLGSKRPRVIVPTCIVRPFLSNATLANVLDKYCKEPGVDCSVIRPGARCFLPNTLEFHAAVVVNQFYRFHKRNRAFCPRGIGALVFPNPSRFDCIS